MKRSGGDGVKLERKTVEKNRRIHMKNLCFKLTSLIPMSKRSITQQDLLDQALCYINDLRERVELLKRKKLDMTMAAAAADAKSGITRTAAAAAISEAQVQLQMQPQVVLRSMGSCNLEVNLIWGSRTRRSMLREVIGVLEEEGAQVSTTCFSSSGDRIFHTIHCQAISSRIGLDPSRVHQRLREVIGQRFCFQELAPQGVRLMYAD